MKKKTFKDFWHDWGIFIYTSFIVIVFVLTIKLTQDIELVKNTKECQEDCTTIKMEFFKIREYHSITSATKYNCLCLDNMTKITNIWD